MKTLSRTAILLTAFAFAATLCSCASIGTAVQESEEKTVHAETVERDETVPAADTTPAITADITSPYRIGVMDNTVLSVPEKIQNGVFERPAEFIEPLINFLIGDVEDEFARVKILHDWIADNISYDVEAFLAGEIGGQEYEAVLRSGSSVCEGYSGLFNKMSDLAGIECVTIHGYARGYGYNVFDVEDVGDTNHAWNAVRIDGTWYLVDTTWDAGFVERDTYVKRYSTKYLYLRPEQMIYSHYPSEEGWQLVDNPVSEEEFLALPRLRGIFFYYGIDVPKGLKKINETGDEFKLLLTASDDMMLNGSIYDEAGNQHSAFTQRREGVTELTFRFPSPGEWRAILFGKFKSEEMYTGCGEVGLVASEGNPKLFPVQFGTFFEHDCYLHAPLYSPLKEGAEESFTITIPGASQAALVVNGEWTMLERTAEGSDEFSAKLVIPETDKVMVYAVWGENNSFNGLLEFSVVK